MREIKFRLWQTIWPDKELQIMHPVTKIDFEDRIYFVTTSIVGYRFQDAILMQYTNLKDAKGDDIYEGDILRTQTGKPMVVTWNNKFASFCLDREGWAFLHWFGESCRPEDTEIIGNIYQNPNLLV